MSLNNDCARRCGNSCCDSTGQVFSSPAERENTIALVGQPNTGKSTLFNLITGANQHVGNWPGKTIEKKEGLAELDGQTYHFYDLPGTYSLTANSLEETIARDFILKERPDVVVVVVDAAQLERSFYMVAEIALLEIPMVIALNKMDIALREGNRINTSAFENQTGLKTVPITASKGKGIDDLLDAVASARETKAGLSTTPDLDKAFGPAFPEVLQSLDGQTPPDYPRRWITMKLLEGDGEITSLLKARMDGSAWRHVCGLLPAVKEGQVAGASARYDWIKSITVGLFERRPGEHKRNRFDVAATHPLWGKIIALGTLLLAVVAAYAVAIPLMIPGFVLFFTSDWVQGLLSKFAPAWFSAMIADGLMGGLCIASIITGFIGAVFMVLGFLENTGYLARLAYVFDPFMRRIGLHGKSILPLLMGFICNILGVAASRVIDTWKQRLVTLVIAPIIPCKGLFVVVGFICAVFFGGKSLPIFLALGLVTLVYLSLTSKLLQVSLLKGDSSGLIMELPLYHRPNWRNVWVYAWTRLKIFYHRGFWFIVISCVLAWLGIHFPHGSAENSYLAQFGRTLEPLGQIMGWDWRLCISYVAAIFSKEGTLGAMAVIFGATTSADTDLVGIAMDQNLWEFIKGGGLATYLAATGITPAGALAFVFAVFFSLPCAGTLAMIYAETRSLKWTCFTFFYYLFMSLLLGALAYQAGLLIWG